MPDINSGAAVRCAPDAGRVEPRIDRSRCEAKSDCVRVCPYHVFDVRALSSDERRDLSFFSRLKLLVHGGKQAFAERAADCHACGLCVKACPENAITLVSI